MKISFLTGSRGEWGYIRPLLRLCEQANISYHICVTNMHLLPANGMSANEIRADGFEVHDEILMALDGGNHYAMTKSLGIFLTSFVDVLNRVKPDWLILAGDRGEQLMGAIASSYTYTPVAHIQAGELSGNIDGLARHAIGKLIHLHFAANEDAKQRLINLGEQSFRIHNVGAPQLDELVKAKYTNLVDLQKKYSANLTDGYILVVQHPVTEEYDQAPRQIEQTINALKKFPYPKIWILPNNDAGSHFITDGIQKNRDVLTHVFENLKREDYLGFMKYAKCMIGNSSSGLLEAPTFELPAVNIGRRQHSRIRGANVIDVDFNEEQIEAAIKKAMSEQFRQSLKGMKNPYGDGNSAERIIDILKQTKRDQKLLIKELTY